MKKQEKINAVYTLLDENSPKVIEFLKAPTIWQLLICIILSSQTTDKQVMKVSEHLFKRFTSLSDFMNSPLDDIKDEIKSIGFYNAKAKNIKETARILCTEFNGEVPLDIDTLTALPGVGRKTANCIIGHAKGEDAVIVDTHFKRVVNRLGLTKSSDPQKIEMEIRKLLPPQKTFRFSMTANLFGREICHARGAECEKCYLREFCTV